MSYFGPIVFLGAPLSRKRRSVIGPIVAVCVVLGTAHPALAQDSLPDPNASKAPAPKTADANLPTTGIETDWLVLGGIALLASGVAVRPVARRRRMYRTDTWEHVVRSAS